MNNTSKPVRKACDFCYRRRLKCDSRKPVCSSCSTHSAECTYGAPSRKANSRKPNKHSEARFHSLEAEVRHLKYLLQSNESRQHSVLAPSTSPAVQTVYKVDGFELPFGLPSYEEVLPMLNSFLAHLNSVIPLFHEQTLRNLFENFYSRESLRHDPVILAAVHVVLALEQRHSILADGEHSNANMHLNQAQSLVSEVILGEPYLLNVQILLGMVILLQGSPDHQPPLILIATAMRLAHKLGLHDRTSSILLDPDIATQRANVFWIAYIIDKDISMRLRQPSIQLDDDIDLDLPSGGMMHHLTGDDSDNAGVLETVDKSLKWNYFRARIQLATIEGGVYDFLYSTRAQKRNDAERDRALDSVDRALQQWKASIPNEFGTSAALKHVSLHSLHFMAALHGTAFQCATLINHAHAWNPKWVSDLRMTATKGTSLALPPSWNEVVHDARDLVTICRALPDMDSANFWVNGCSYMSAVMILTANLVHADFDSKTVDDNGLVDIGLDWISKMGQSTGNENVIQFRDTCRELKQTSRARLGIQVQGSSPV